MASTVWNRYRFERKQRLIDAHFTTDEANYFSRDSIGSQKGLASLMEYRTNLYNQMVKDGKRTSYYIFVDRQYNWLGCIATKPSGTSKKDHSKYLSRWNEFNLSGADTLQLGQFFDYHSAGETCKN